MVDDRHIHERHEVKPGRRHLAAFAVIAVIALVHVVGIGTWMPGGWRMFYSGYASDILIPIAAYFILVLAERKNAFLRAAGTKAAIVFGIASVCEISQGVGVPLLGRTFDPVDFFMYAAGGAFALALDVFTLRVHVHLAPGEASR